MLRTTRSRLFGVFALLLIVTCLAVTHLCTCASATLTDAADVDIKSVVVGENDDSKPMIGDASTPARTTTSRVSPAAVAQSTKWAKTESNAFSEDAFIAPIAPTVPKLINMIASGGRLNSVRQTLAKEVCDSGEKCTEEEQASGATLTITSSSSFEQRLAELKAIVGNGSLKGWNSYDSYNWFIDEETFLANIQVVHDVLLPSGFNIVSIDYYWYLASDMSAIHLDKYGRPQPDMERFPTSSNGQGFKYLADIVHDMGMLFGIHLMRGISTAAIKANLPVFNSSDPMCTTAAAADMTNPCPWAVQPHTFYSVNTSSSCGMAFYNSLTAQYAEWGVDFIKNDCVFSNYAPDQVEGLGKAIDNSGRPMLFSLSPGSDNLTQVATVAPIVNMYRSTTDTWDSWSNLLFHFDAAAKTAPFIGVPGRYGLPSFPDLDMLPLGWISDVNNEPTHWSRLTLDEQQTLLTLWMITRSPLIMGGDLTHNEPNVISKLTNPEAIEISDNSKYNVQLPNTLNISNFISWNAESTTQSGVFYVALFNIDDGSLLSLNASIALFAPSSLVSSSSSSSSSSIECDVRDVWLRTDLGRSSALTLPIDVHCSFLLSLSNCASTSVLVSSSWARESRASPRTLSGIKALTVAADEQEVPAVPSAKKTFIMD